MCSLAVSKVWSIRQLDVNNAFLQGFLTETVYMEQPSGFINPAHPNHVCKLHRSIYGLKQAPRAWFSRLSSYLVTLGFVGSKSDTSLFLRRVGTDLLLVLIYVDDIIIITGNDSRAVTRLIQELGREFSLKDLGPLHYFLGMECHRTPSGLFRSQQKYIRNLLLRLKMDGVKPVSSPIATSCKLSKIVGKTLSTPLFIEVLLGLYNT